MALATYAHLGLSIDYTPTSDVTAGDVVLFGDLVCVAKEDIDANRKGAVATFGVFDFAKEAGGGVTFALGDLAYWDATNEVVVTTDGGGTHKLVGECVDDAAADADDTARIFLHP